MITRIGGLGRRQARPLLVCRLGWCKHRWGDWVGARLDPYWFAVWDGAGTDGRRWLTHLEVCDYFEAKEFISTECEYHKSVQKGHGMLETREIWISTHMSEWFAKDWAGIAQVFMIRRVLIDGIDRREKIAYGFTNLSRKQANAEQVLSLNQKHWVRMKIAYIIGET